jgi:uroporphyrinogen-III synthase
MAQSARFAASLRQRFGADLAVTISPLISPHFLTPAFPAGNWAGLVFTSETGVEGFLRHTDRPLGLPRRVFCVGNRTAKAALAAGLDPVSANGDAADLIDLIGQENPRGPLLHLCGTQTRGDVAATLTQAGHATTALTLYAQLEQPLNAAGCALLLGTGPVLVPLFSPRTSVLFRKQLMVLGHAAPLICAALSDAVAEPLADVPGLTLCHAQSPTAKALMAAIARILQLP